MKKLLSILVLLISFGAVAQVDDAVASVERPSQYIIELTVEIGNEPVKLVNVKDGTSIIVARRFYRNKTIALDLQLNQEYILIINGIDALPFSVNGNREEDMGDHMRVIAAVIQ